MFDANIKPNLAFIVGAPRSGTTLLMSILLCHPEIHGLFEYKFMLIFKKKYEKKDFRLKKYRFALSKDFIDYLEHKRLITAQGIFDRIVQMDKKVIDVFIQSNNIEDYSQAIMFLYRSISILGIKTIKPKVILEKNPVYTQHLDKLFEICPTAKCIGIIRNHRDAVSSRVSSGTGSSQNIQYFAKYWELVNKRFYQFTVKYKNNVLPIFYKDLLQSPEETIQKCLNFLSVGTDYDYTVYKSYYKDLMTSLKDDPVLMNNERAKKKFGDLSRPINSTAVNKWRERINVSQKGIIDAICQNASNLFFKDKMFIEKTSPKLINGLAYYKAILNFYIDEHRYQLPPKVNFFLEKLVRTIGVV